MSNVFQKIAGGFKRILPGLVGIAGDQIVPGGGVAAKALLNKLPKSTTATPTEGGYEGLYGTNQNYKGSGGYNYASPQGRTLPVTPPATGGASSGGGTGGGYSASGGSSAPAAAPTNQGNDQFDAFNLLLTDALRRSQGVNSDELLRRRRALQRASIGRSDEITAEDMRTLSPSQQASIRDGQLKALEPDIDENAYQIKKAESLTANFEKVYTEARKFGEDFAQKVEAPEDVITSYKRLIEADPSNLATILSGVNEKTRMKVISSLNPGAFAAAAAKKGSSGGGGFNFTDTQLAKGAAAAGMTLQQFRALTDDAKNQYINGTTSDLPAAAATIAGKIVDKFDTLFRSKAKAKAKAIEAVNAGGGKMTINGKVYTVSPAELAEMIQTINNY